MLKLPHKAALHLFLLNTEVLKRHTLRTVSVDCHQSWDVYAIAGSIQVSSAFAKCVARVVTNKVDSLAP